MSKLIRSSIKRLSARRREAGVVLGLLVCGLALPVAYRASSSASPVIAAPAGAPLALRFEPGAELRYEVTWSGRQRGRLFSSNAGAGETHVESATDMALDMSLFVESVKGDEATLVLSFTDVPRHRLELLGAVAFPSREQAAAALVRRYARVRIGTDGTSRDVAFEEGTPDVFMNVVQWIVAQSALSLAQSGRSGAWEARERGPFGMSRVRYSRAGQELARERAEYVSFDAFANGGDGGLKVRELSGKTQARLRSGLIELLRTEERVRVDGPSGAAELDGTVRFELRLVRVERRGAPPPEVAYGVAAPAGEPVVGPETLEKLLQERIAGMTPDELLGALERFGAGGVLPEQTRWLWRATGLLKAEPKLASELVRVALAPGSTDKTKSLVMDLLASVGHAEAQAAMRNLLASPALASSPLRAALVQRVSFLEHPSPETIDAAREAFAAGKASGFADLAYASAHALAASAGAALVRGDEATARELVQELGREIAEAPDEQARANLLGALTNARGDAVLAIAEPYATSQEAALREASAEALRNIQSPKSTELLLGLLGDPAFEVRSAALASLGERPLDAKGFERIRQWMDKGKLGTRLDGALLTLAQASLGLVPEARNVVLAIAAHPGASPATRARARALLDEAG